MEAGPHVGWHRHCADFLRGAALGDRQSVEGADAVDVSAGADAHLVVRPEGRRDPAETGRLVGRPSVERDVQQAVSAARLESIGADGASQAARVRVGAWDADAARGCRSFPAIRDPFGTRDSASICVVILVARHRGKGGIHHDGGARRGEPALTPHAFLLSQPCPTRDRD